MAPPMRLAVATAAVAPAAAAAQQQQQQHHHRSSSRERRRRRRQRGGERTPARSRTTSVRKRTSPEPPAEALSRAAAKPSANPSGGMHVAMELNVATLEEHLPMTIRAAMSGERRSSALTVAVPVAATASLPGSERFESPLPRSAIGPQILSEHKNNYHASFGHEKRACAASHVSAAAAAARSASSPRERRSPPQASERVPSSVYDLESYSPTQGGAKPAHGGGVGGPHVARHPSPAGVHGHADSSASSPLGGSPISGKSRKLNLPKFYSQRQGITLAELQAPVEPEIDSEIDAKAAEGGADEAGEPPKASLWAKGGLRAKIGALGKLAEAAQRDKEEAAVASDADRQRLLVAASEHVDDLVRILTEWDKEFRGDGRVTKRDFRRVLPLKNVFAERHVTDALFEFLVFEELKRQGKVSTEVREAEGGQLIKQDMIVDKHGSGLAPSMAPAALAAAANIDLTHSTLEIWQLDRALRWAEGSRAKRSRLLTGKALEEVAMLQDNDKSVQQNLRDTLVNHALRVMDLFREWDADGNGEITKEEFRHALPMLGLHASYDDVEELFEGFDADSSGSISFRELNRQLRRDVKNERKAEKSKAEVVDLIDVTTLRQTVRQGLMAYANFRVDVHEDVDPITGMKRS